ncbi:hypothetical protein V2W45_1520928 [Cenococcum geophilum]
MLRSSLLKVYGTIVRKRQQRKLVKDGESELIFTVRGNKVEPQKIDRWVKRNGVPESLLYALTTLSDVGCQTVSERGSPVPSPTYSIGAPNFSPAAQSPQIFSPALLVSGIVRPQGSTFTRQSPAPIYQPLPNFIPGSPPALNAFQDQSELCLREKLSKMETLYGISHSKALYILFKLGNILIDQRRYRSAKGVIYRLVEGRQIINSNDDVNTLKALELLRQAKKLYRKIFKSRRVILEDKHLNTLTSIARRWKKAEELDVREAKELEVVLRAEHLSTLTSINNLAFTLKSQSYTKEAISLIEKCFQI